MLMKLICQCAVTTFTDGSILHCRVAPEVVSSSATRWDIGNCIDCTTITVCCVAYEVGGSSETIICYSDCTASVIFCWMVDEVVDEVVGSIEGKYNFGCCTDYTTSYSCWVATKNSLLSVNANEMLIFALIAPPLFVELQMNLLVPLKVSTALCSVKIAPSFSERCIWGCGITAFNSTLTFTGNTAFLNNRHNSSQAC